VIGLNLGGVFLASKAAASESSPPHSHQHILPLSPHAGAQLLPTDPPCPCLVM
jgi:hypothetical protein